MCRLFGMCSAPRRVRATFWLLEAEDSLRAQSRANPDGTGLGAFTPDGTPELFREPVPAWHDPDFNRAARHLESATFAAHVRYASTGALSVSNTHPFEQDGRLFAHNGVIGDLHLLDAELAASAPGEAPPVLGQTDSERFFSLISREIHRHGGDVGAGIASAANWVATNLPLYALNMVLTTADELWALRYPANHELWILHRPAGGTHGGRHLEQSSAGGRLRVRSDDLAQAPVVVVASERMDDDPDWRLLASGELVHVQPGPHLRQRLVVNRDPAHPLTIDDLSGKAAASQARL